MQVTLEIDKSTEDTFKDIGIKPVEAIKSFLEYIKVTKDLPFKIPNEEILNAIEELKNGDVKKITFDEMKDLINA